MSSWAWREEDQFFTQVPESCFGSHLPVCVVLLQYVHEFFNVPASKCWRPVLILLHTGGPYYSLPTNRICESDLLAVSGHQRHCCFLAELCVSFGPLTVQEASGHGVRTVCSPVQSSLSWGRKPLPISSKRLGLPAHSCAGEPSWKWVLESQPSFHLTAASTYVFLWSPWQSLNRKHLVKFFPDALASENVWDKHLLFHVTKSGVSGYAVTETWLSTQSYLFLIALQDANSWHVSISKLVAQAANQYIYCSFAPCPA